MNPKDYLSATVEKYPWGEVRWLHNAETGTSSLTISVVTINPGSENRNHYHPNCEEVMYLISGEIEFRFEGAEPVRLKTGMSVHIPYGMTHNAKCVGAEPAKILSAYSSAHHQVIEV